MHEDLTRYDIIPEDKRMYLANYGPHFSKKLVKFAVSKMYKRDADGKKVKITPYTKDEVDSLLETYNIRLENNKAYDHVFVANMGKADLLGSSVPNEDHLAKYVKNVIDDPDGYEGLPFARWLTDMYKKGEVIVWEDMI